ncbi:MAG: hypothetical protein R3324_13625, partial [Halobacteriales archaeon]|nr:hypothetical protein [Halobacteriales archaeon]
MTRRWVAVGWALVIGLPTGLGVYMAALKSSGNLPVSIAMGVVTAIVLGILVLVMAFRGSHEAGVAPGVLPDHIGEG